MAASQRARKRPAGGARTVTSLELRRLLLLLLLAVASTSLAGAGDADSSPCNILRLVAGPSLTTAQFDEAVRQPGLPAILTNVSTHWAAHAKWSWDHIRQVAGDNEVGTKFAAVAVGRGAAIAERGLAAASLPSLGAFVDQHVLNRSNAAEADPLYVFDPDFFHRVTLSAAAAALAADFTLPIEYFPSFRSATLVAGPTGSGLGFHAHGEAVNVLIRGAKRWFAYAPGRLSLAMRMNVSLSGKGWHDSAYDSLPANAKPDVDCVQNAGEVMYLPARWKHATWNLEPALGLANNQEAGSAAALEVKIVAARSVLAANAAVCSSDSAATQRAECAAQEHALAKLLGDAGQLDEAIFYARRSALGGDIAEHYYTLGRLLSRKGGADNEAAANILQSYDLHGGKKLAPICGILTDQGLEGCYRLGFAAVMKKRYKLAVRAGKRGLRVHDKLSAAAGVDGGGPFFLHGLLLLLCRAHAHLTEWASAEKHCRASVQANAGYEEGWVGWGRSLMELGRLSEAQNALEQVVDASGGGVGADKGSMINVAVELLGQLASRQRLEL